MLIHQWILKLTRFTLIYVSLINKLNISSPRHERKGDQIFVYLLILFC